MSLREPNQLYNYRGYYNNSRFTENYILQFSTSYNLLKTSDYSERTTKNVVKVLDSESVFFHLLASLFVSKISLILIYRS